MKSILKTTVLVAGTVLLASCGFGNTSTTSSDGKAASGNSDVQFELLDGTYVVPPEESTVNDEQYLALKVKVTNKSDDKVSVSLDSFALYDSDDSKMNDYNIYGENDEFHTISSETISKGKSLTGYVVYKVDEDAKYNLHFEPTFSDYEKEPEELSVKVDAGKYEDNTDEVLDLAKTYVNEVFLSGNEAANTETLSVQSSTSNVMNLSSKEDSDDKDKDKDKEDDKKPSLSNNIEEDRTSFTSTFISALGEQFDYYEPSQAELKTFIDAYVKANAERGTIQYSIKSYTIDSAEIYIKPETIDIASIDTTSIITDFVEKNRNTYSDYDAARQAAEKYLLEQLPTKLNTTGLASGDSMPGEGYAIKLTKDKDSNKWKIDSSDNSDNYSYEYIVQAFMGNLYSY